MRNTALVILLVAVRLGAQTTPYVYVPVNDLRQERDRAQREWQRTAPNLESHLTTAPKNQVLTEIESARAAARRFGEAEVRYLEGRLTTVDSQIANLQTRGVAPPADLAKQMVNNMQAMMQHLANDRQSIQVRLDQLNAAKQTLSNEEVLTRNKLNEELKLVTDAYVALAQQRDTLETTTNPTGPHLEELRGALVSDLIEMQQITQQQRNRAQQSIELFESYYGNLRTAVQKRPDDAGPSSAAPPSSTGRAAASPARAGAVESDSRRSPIPTASNNRAAASAPSAASAKSPLDAAASRPPTFAGRWTLPEGRAPQVGECHLKSAEMWLEVKNKRVSGRLTLRYDQASSTCLRPDKSSNELSLDLEGSLDGQSAIFTLTQEARRVDLSVKGRLDMRLLDQYRAIVTVDEGVSSRLGLSKAEFQQLPPAQPRTPASK